MRTLRLLSLAAVLLMLPGLARAAPERIALAEYQNRLEQALQQVEAAQRAASSGGDAEPAIAAARRLLDGTWLVDAGQATAEADLRPIAALLPTTALSTSAGQRALAVTGDALREHLRAAEALGRPADAPRIADARKKLNESLAEGNGRNWWNDWVQSLWDRLFANRVASNASIAVLYGSVLWIWLAGIIGGLGLILLTYGLLRNLSGHAAGGESHLRQGRPGRPAGPSTPEHLWETARHHADQGDYKEGLRLVHLALLQHFDRLSLLRFDPAHTNREHERLLRRKFPSLARSLYALNDLVEIKLYSGFGASADDFSRGNDMARALWREGDDASKSVQAPSGASSSASSR